MLTPEIIHALQLIAAFFWAVTHFACIIIRFYTWKAERKQSHLRFIAAHFICAVWGITIPGMNELGIIILNSIFLPFTGGIVFLSATVNMFNQKLK